MLRITLFDFNAYSKILSALALPLKLTQGVSMEIFLHKMIINITFSRRLEFENDPKEFVDK